MSGYARKVEIQVEFEGQQVRLVLKPLTRGDLFEIQALLPTIPRLPDGKADMSRVTAENVGRSNAAFSLYASKLPGYVLESNVSDAAGATVAPEEWCEAAYFTALVSDVMTLHMEKASPANPSSSAAPPASSTASA